jgi:hypothetical protein
MAFIDLPIIEMKQRLTPLQKEILIIMRNGKGYDAITIYKIFGAKYKYPYIQSSMNQLYMLEITKKVEGVGRKTKVYQIERPFIKLAEELFEDMELLSTKQSWEKEASDFTEKHKEGTVEESPKE